MKKPEVHYLSRYVSMAHTSPRWGLRAAPVVANLAQSIAFLPENFYLIPLFSILVTFKRFPADVTL